EAAARELVALGAAAYPSLVRAARNTDPEIAQRVNAVLKQIRAKVPPRELRLKVDDYVKTAEFPISGRITSPSIKAKTAYFGELQLKIGELRAIHWMAGAGGTVVTVEATKHGTAPNQWMDTNVNVEPDVPLLLTVTGEVDLLNDGTGQFITGPRGARNVGGRGGMHLPGALLGRIGPSGPVFLVGERYE